MTGVALLQSIPEWVSTYPGAKLIAEIAWGADLTADPDTWTWTDITAHVLFSAPISISPMGRSDWSSKTQPAACTFGVGADDSASKYMRGPQSANYPNVHQNVPLRVSVAFSALTTQVLFQGEAWSFKPTWNTRGNLATVTIKAAGKMRQLTQGTHPALSPFKRAILATTTPTLRRYWSCEDGPASQVVASALQDGVALLPNDAVKFASFNISTAELTAIRGVTYGTDLLPQLKDGGSFGGSFGAGSGTAWTVQATTYVDVFDVTATVAVMEWQCPGSTYPVWRFISDSDPAHLAVDATRVVVFNSSGTATTVCSLPGIAVLSEVRVDASQSGSNIAVSLSVVNSQGEQFTDTGTLSSATLAGVNYWIANPDETSLGADFSVGHVRIWDGNTAPDFQTPAFAVSAWTSYNGENAITRLERLFDEEGVALDVTGTSDTLMGPQPIATFMDAARQCEAADLGVLGDGRGPGCYYVSRSARYNQDVSIALDATDQELFDAPEPEDDDQTLRNRYTVERLNGSTAVYADIDGPLGTDAVGTYDATPGGKLNLNSDGPLRNIAAWLVHLGTVEGYRYPTLSLDIARIIDWAFEFATLSPGNRITVDGVSDVSAEHPPGLIDLLAEGWSMQITPYDWTATLNCSQARPWNVAQLDAWPLEMAGQTLASSLAAGATTLSLATATGYNLFTTTARFPNDFPRLLNVGGWPINVTAASGTSSPQTLTIDASPNTSTIVSGTPVTLWQPAVLAL